MSRSVSQSEIEQVLSAVRMWGDYGTVSKIASTLRDKVPERTLKRWLTQLVQEGRLIRRGASSGTRYRLAPTEVGNGAGVGADGVAAVSPPAAVPGSPNGEPARHDDVRKALRRPLSARPSVSYQRAVLDAYHPNEMAYLTESQRLNLSRRVSPVLASALSPADALAAEWQRYTADLAVWSRDAQESLGFVPRRHRRAMRPQIVAGVVARADVPSMAGELRRIWNHRAAVTAVVALTQTSGLTWATVSAMQAALTRLPAPAAAVDGTNGAPAAPIAVAAVSPGCRPLCRTEPLVLAGTTYHPTADSALIEPCLRQIVLTAAAIRDPAEASFFTFAQLLLLLPFAAENLSSAVLLASVPLLAAHLQPVSLAALSPSEVRVAVLSWWELGRVDLLAQLWTRPAAPPAR